MGDLPRSSIVKNNEIRINFTCENDGFCFASGELCLQESDSVRVANRLTGYPRPLIYFDFTGAAALANYFLKHRMRRYNLARKLPKQRQAADSGQRNKRA